jgi:hypothetical protein
LKPHKQNKYLVFELNLMELFKICTKCCSLYILSTFVGMDPENKIPADIDRFPAGFPPTYG